MNAEDRNNILIAVLEKQDLEDDLYILPGSGLTYRVAYDESDWLQGKEKRIAFVEWTHPPGESIITCKPVLSPAKSWTVKNDDDFRANMALAVDALAEHIKKDYE